MFTFSSHSVLRFLAVGLALAHTAGVSAEHACVVSPFQSGATSAAGILFACPQGDGDLLSDKGLTITVTAMACLSPVPGIPATDMWVIGCATDLSVCAAAYPFTTGSTDLQGMIVLDGRLFAGGCDNSGLRVVVQGVTFQTCIPIQTRTPDFKASGQGACGGDLLCPDGKVDLADLSFFSTHYPTALNPGATYFACADLASPSGGRIGLSDFAKFSTHFAGGHGCP